MQDRLLAIVFASGLLIGTTSILWRDGREPQPRRPLTTQGGASAPIRSSPDRADRRGASRPGKAATADLAALAP